LLSGQDPIREDAAGCGAEDDAQNALRRHQCVATVTATPLSSGMPRAPVARNRTVLGVVDERVSQTSCDVEGLARTTSDVETRAAGSVEGVLTFVNRIRPVVDC
jgi:hypothetical protein